MSVSCAGVPLAPHSFPTRRSSDLPGNRNHGRRHSWLDGFSGVSELGKMFDTLQFVVVIRRIQVTSQLDRPASDRKSTRLNSSHLVISYAVFCLKTQTTETTNSHKR